MLNVTYFEHLGMENCCNGINDGVDVGFGDGGADVHRVEGGGLAAFFFLHVSSFGDIERRNFIINHFN